MMVKNLSEEILECLRYPEEHGRQAKGKQAKITRGLSGNGAPVAAAGPKLPVCVHGIGLRADHNF